jgi:hypothetical protein
MYSATRVYPIGIRTILDMYDCPIGTSDRARQLMSGRAAAGCCRLGLGSGSSIFGVMKYMIDEYYGVQHVM